MSGSNTLYNELRDPKSVTIDGSGPLGGWEDAYLVNGAVRECHPDFIATPIGKNPNGFLVCQRRKPGGSFASPEPPNPPKRKVGDCMSYSQSYNLYDDKPAALPRYTFLGGQPYALADRRLPNQAHLQGADYYRDAILFRGIGDENLDQKPGDFGYRENKYYFSAPPPLFDITQGVQPYPLWRREQLRMGTVTEKQMNGFEKYHTYTNVNPVF